MFNSSSPLGRLLDAPMRPGSVTWIGLRPARRATVLPVRTADMTAEQGLMGDHYQGRSTPNRHVTLVQAEHLAAIAAYLGVEPLDPARLRRNIVVAGFNLHALKDRQFLLGSATLVATGVCHPCSRMEEMLGIGGYNAVRGHGGITARVLQAGQVSIGDPIIRVP